MSGSTDRRVALVTGAGSGLGRATAQSLARDGHSVAVSDIDEAAGAETVSLVEHAGGSARFFHCDVADAASVTALFDAVLGALGGLDVAVNNAGIAGPPQQIRFHEYPMDAWERVCGINLTGVFLCMQRELQHMVSVGSGAIVNVASFAGLRGGTGRCSYIASKHGVVGLTRAAALEYATEGIRVNAVCPGPILTPLLEPMMADPALAGRYNAMSPLNRLAQPEEVADTIAWLCSAAASYLNGVALPVDGGASAR